MRFEEHPWNNLTIRLEVIEDDGGITGLSPTATLRRTSNGNYLQSGGGWGGSPSTLSLAEVSSTDHPGLYAYQVGSTDLDSSDGSYVAQIVEATEGVRENVLITTKISGDDQRRLLDLHQSRFRLIASAWDPTTKQPIAGMLYVYPSQAAYEADTVPDGSGAYGEYEMAASFSSGQLQHYGSSKQS